MPCILFRMKMKKTRNVLRIRKANFEIFLSSQNERRRRKKGEMKKNCISSAFDGLSVVFQEKKKY